MTRGETPDWETEFWSYVSRGDGAHCCLWENCQHRREGKWCPDDNKERLAQLREHEQFNISDYNLVRREKNCKLARMVEMLAE